ncbi:inositol monophosphatase [Spirochaetia bacterium]|nr:inositol monophosphatase [Spirochaetia bacterium]
MGTIVDLNSLTEQIKVLAVEAAGLVRDKKLGTQSKGPKDFVTQVDLCIDEFLSSRLPSLVPGSLVLSEEGDDDEKRAEYQWIVDPIDGTTNLIYGLPLYAVSIGLVKNGRPLAGAVYNPPSGELFSAYQGGGAFLNNRPIHVNTDAKLAETLVLAETDPYLERKKNFSPHLINEVFSECIDYRVTGSAALDVCFIACGRGGVFFTQCVKPWDYAGGSIILLEAGGTITQWDKSPLPFEGKHGILATNGLLHAEMLKKIEAYLKEFGS